MKIIAEVPDEAAPAVRETLEWIAGRAYLSYGEVLTISAGEDYSDCSLRVRLLSLAIAEEEPDPWPDLLDEEAFRAQFAPGRRVRFDHPDAGWPGDPEQAAERLILGEVYVIEWSDIGGSWTRLGLVGIDSRGQGFNSVLFEPVDDEETAATAAGGE